jgi:hypothetical protein
VKTETYKRARSDSRSATRSPCIEMLPRKSILKLAGTLVIKKKLDLAHFQLKIVGTAAAQPYPRDWWKARGLPKVDNCSLPVAACLESQCKGNFGCSPNVPMSICLSATSRCSTPRAWISAYASTIPRFSLVDNDLSATRQACGCGGSIAIFARPSEV